MTVSKRDLVQAVAESTGCSKLLAATVVDRLFAAMREELVQGNRIEVRGFGVLGVKDTAAKPAARNPRTGEIIQVPARRKAYFKPGKELKEGLHAPPPAPDNRA